MRDQHKEIYKVRAKYNDTGKLQYRMSYKHIKWLCYPVQPKQIVQRDCIKQDLLILVKVLQIKK